MSTKLTKTQLSIFALPAMVSTLMHGPLTGILPTLYSAKFGIDLTVIGTVLLISRIFDAVTDPLIGYLSDRTNSRFGKRKPWVGAGAAMSVLAIYLLFVPGETSNATYFLSLLVFLYLAWTIMEIPLSAWVLELSRRSKERTRINAARAAAIFVGGVAFAAAPALVPSSGGEMNFDVLKALALVIVVVVPLVTILALVYVPQGDVYDQAEAPGIGELWASIKVNKPFQYFVAFYIFFGIVGGITGVVSFMYVDDYLKIGDKFAQIFVPAQIAGPIFIPVWAYLMNKFGKYRVITLGLAVFGLILPLPWFIAPGESAFVPMVIYYTALGVITTLMLIAMPTILGDVIDHDEIQTGKNRAGQYYSFLALLTKGTSAIVGPIALAAIGFYGYQPGAETNSAEAISSLRITYALLPPLFVIPAVWVIWKFPINDKIQRANRAMLEERSANAADTPDLAPAE